MTYDKPKVTIELDEYNEDFVNFDDTKLSPELKSFLESLQN